MIKKLDHLVITASDLEQTLSFYERLGFRHVSNNGRSHLLAGDFKINVHTIGAELSPHALNVKTGSADFCVEITDELDDFIKYLESINIETEGPKTHKNGALGPMMSVYLRDPDGNLVEFCKYES